MRFIFFRCVSLKFLGPGLLIAITAMAQTATTASFTLEDALARVVERHPAFAAQSYATRTADARIEQAGLRPNPTLELGVENVLGTGRVQGVRSSETTVQAAQTFERGGKRDKRLALAGRERDVVLQEFAVRRADLLASTARAFVAVLVAQERLALAVESPRLARETVEIIDRHVAAGAASAVELARARAALAAAQADSARAQSALSTARAVLASTWAGSSSDVSTLTGALRLPPHLPSETELRAPLSSHPRLALHTALIASQRASLALAQAQASADVTASGGVRFLREGTDAAFVAGVSVPLPGPNKNQGNIRAGRETLAAAEHTARALESELQASFSAAWQELAAAHTLAQQLRRDALPPAEEASTAARRAYEAGSIPLTDVLDVHRALLAIRREILDAESDYATALVRLEAFTRSDFPATAALLSSR